MRISNLLGAGLATVVAGAAAADITGAYVVTYSVTAEDFGGTSVSVNVADMYLSSDNGADVALNVYNMNMANGSGDITYFQSATGTGWLANNLGSIFDNPAIRLADSFVTIGGMAQDTLIPEQAPGAGAGTGLDPNFGGNNAAAPGALAGWFNSSPPNLNGQVGAVANTTGGTSLGVMVARFTYDGAFDLIGTTLEVTWNQGLGTGGQQGAFTVTPAPGALALLGLAGVAGRRRRG